MACCAASRRPVRGAPVRRPPTLSLVMPGIAGGRSRAADAETEPGTAFFGRHHMRCLLPRHKLAVNESQVYELPLVALLGVGVEQSGGDVVGVGTLGVAPDFGVLVSVLAKIGLAPLLMHVGDALADLEVPLHPRGAHLG